LVPQQIVDLRVLGEVFDPAEFGPKSAPWSIPRAWDSPPCSTNMLKKNDVTQM
jgi:hypothetical protein